MIRVARPPAPDFLVEKGAAWATAFVERRRRDPAARFSWPRHQREPINRALGELLGAMTAHHCAYCDHFELGEGSRDTIDHFRPKSVYPELAFAWDNLFPACDMCQTAKAELFDEALPRPDANDFSFDRFFVVNHRSGEIEPNSAASEADRSSAAAAIRILRLNRAALTNARLRWLRSTYGLRVWPNRREPLDTLPYRFMAPSSAAADSASPAAPVLSAAD